MAKKFLFALLIPAVWLSSCATPQNSIEANTEHNQVLQTRDTIFAHDTILERSRGDTVFVTRISNRYRTKIVLQHDTVAVQSATVRTVEKPPKWAYWCLVLVILFVLLAVARIIWAFCRRKP